MNNIKIGNNAFGVALNNEYGIPSHQQSPEFLAGTSLNTEKVNTLKKGTRQLFAEVAPFIDVANTNTFRDKKIEEIHDQSEQEHVYKELLKTQWGLIKEQVEKYQLETRFWASFITTGNPYFAENAETGQKAIEKYKKYATWLDELIRNEPGFTPAHKPAVVTQLFTSNAQVNALIEGSKGINTFTNIPSGFVLPNGILPSGETFVQILQSIQKHHPEIKEVMVNCNPVDTLGEFVRLYQEIWNVDERNAFGQLFHGIAFNGDILNPADCDNTNEIFTLNPEDRKIVADYAITNAKLINTYKANHVKNPELTVEVCCGGDTEFTKTLSEARTNHKIKTTLPKHLQSNKVFPHLEYCACNDCV